jgi:tetratricopeptide (TPR) repeat protein
MSRKRSRRPSRQPLADGADARRSEKAGAAHRSRVPQWLIAAGLVAGTALVYASVASFNFVNLDDRHYIHENPEVVSGLSWNSIRWSFTTQHAANWHPLTWISHMADCQFFGLAPGPPHVVNLLLHITSVCVLFVVLRRMMGRVGPSAFASALFAIHPLHVESVAWVSERKDVLSGLFAMLTIAAYAAYASRPSIGRYVLVAVLFIAGLLAKPMLVTLPFVLLLLDIWPLARLETSSPGRLAAEKVPLLALSGVSSVLTFFAQRHGLAVVGVDTLPPVPRIEHAMISAVIYLRQTVWPANLAAFYPLTAISWLQATLAAAFLIALSVAALHLRRRAPYLIVGWLWFLGMLVPVIGLVQVGAASHADRYTYLPHVGLFIALAYGAADMTGHLPRQVVIGSALGVLLALALTAHGQVAYWANSVALWTRTVDVNPDSYRAHFNLADALMEENHVAPALAEYQRSLDLNPDFARAQLDLARTLAQSGRTAEALPHYEAALRLTPSDPDTLNGYGNALAALGRLPDAARALQAAIRLRPDFAEALSNLGSVLLTQGQTDEAIANYARAAALEPQSADVHGNFANALYLRGRTTEAIAEARRALTLAPNMASAHEILGLALQAAHQPQEAAGELNEALRLEPSHGRWHYRLALVMLDLHQRGEAIAHLRTAVNLEPGFTPARDLLAELLKAPGAANGGRS